MRAFRAGAGLVNCYEHLAEELLYAEAVDVGEVHAQATTTPEWVTREVRNVLLEYVIPNSIEQLQQEVAPNLPWAEDHFRERVSGKPLNPPPSAAWWPYTRKGHEEHLTGGKFSHTYPERMWPQEAGLMALGSRKGGLAIIRFQMGDLRDLIEVLTHNPYTRQAYLPIWFPEDLTAAKLNARVPCTLGYHFLLREGKLNMTYFIRSCDLVRFFRDDVYMACRLVQWVLDFQRSGINKDWKFWETVAPGNLTMHVVSLHCFEGDLPRLERQVASSGT